MAEQLISNRRALLLGLGTLAATAAAPLTLNAVQARAKPTTALERQKAALCEFMAAAREVDPTIIGFNVYEEIETGAVTHLQARHNDDTAEALLAADADRLLGRCDHAIP